MQNPPVITQREALIRKACNVFIRALEQEGVIFDDNLFEIIENEAAELGYALEAHQQGIRGTHICLRALTEHDRA